MPFFLRPHSAKLLQNFKDNFVRQHSSFPKKNTLPKDSAVKKAAEILEEFQSHPANHHELFKYLEDLAKEGMTPEQYLVYRDNFFYRTSNTVLSVASHATHAVRNHDYQAFVAISRNFSDESGNGNIEGIHLKLLEDGHNFHGKIVFGVPEMTIPNSKNSPFLTPEAINFRKVQERMFRSSYATMTGCLLAHEDAADEMLNNFKKYIFDPYKGYYTEPEFKKLTEYYTVHRDDSKENGNVEEQHKEQALRIASEMIATKPRAEKLILEGGKKFLNIQSDLWNGLMREIENSKFHGPKVIPKSDFLSESKKPSTSIKKNSAKKFVDNPNDKSNSNNI
ncbi:MAG: hypothetical protein EBS06_05815 [Proteobacteria bacterium]|nr:hypothetical protein [Pseudomonadota bacterium]